jgi:hypothetical protein
VYWYRAFAFEFMYPCCPALADVRLLVPVQAACTMRARA